MLAPQPDVSVCVPMYNGERYLRDCIDSVLEQTYSDFELLLVDDCSTDKTLSIAREYVALDSRVRLITNPINLGLVQNWNRCIDVAKCQWIKFVFQDDIIHRDCLARLRSKSRAEIPLVACQRALLFEEGTSERGRRWYVEHQTMTAGVFAKHPVASPESCQGWALDYFGINLFGEPSAVMVHRSAFERFGRFNPMLIMACDLEMWTRISIHGGAVLVPEQLATFRVHGKATSATIHASRQFRLNILDNLIILHQYVYDPAYEPVRQAATQRSLPIDLRKLFTKRCHEARAAADWANRHPAEPDHSLIEEWRNVCQTYPRIGGNSFGHSMWRIKQRLFPALRSTPASGAEAFLDA